MAAALPAIQRAQASSDGGVRQAAQSLVRSLGGMAIFAGDVYSPQEVQEIQKLSECQATSSSTVAPQPDGRLHLTARLAGNGVSFLIVQRVAPATQASP